MHTELTNNIFWGVSNLIAIRPSNLTAIATEMLEAAAVAFGSPILNGTLMPQVAAVLDHPGRA